MKTLWMLLLAATVAKADEEESNMADCAMHEQHMTRQTKRGSGQSAAHFAGVTERGDQAMGFSHERTAHHFGLTPKGGFISADASDAADASSRDAIRQHFQHIAKAFSSGNFELPMFIHAKSPPGVGTLKKLKALIQYRFEETDRGGRIVISTEDPKALRALHRFLRFQIADHQTGDAM